MTNRRPRGGWDSTRQTAPPVTVEVPVLGVGAGPSDYEELARYVFGLRRPRGLHMTLLHLGALDDLCRDVADWTKGNTSAESAVTRTVGWLDALPVLEAFSGSAEAWIPLAPLDTPRGCRETDAPGRRGVGDWHAGG